MVEGVGLVASGFQFFTRLGFVFNLEKSDTILTYVGVKWDRKMNTQEYCMGLE